MRRNRENSIILIAKEVFFSKGIPYTTMKDIASAANITRQTLYLYFKDINQLILAVQGSIANELSSFNVHSNKNFLNLSSKNLIEYFVDSLETMTNKFPKEFIFITEADLHFKRNPVESILFDPLNSLMLSSENRSLLLNKITEGQEAGNIRKDKSPEEIFSVIINITAGVMQRLLLLNNRVDITDNTTPEDILSSLKEMLFLFMNSVSHS